jgi:mono/diheme cytochrome c family protein
MLAWEVPEPTLRDIIQYIKTFSPRWQTESAGASIAVSADPWAAKDQDGIARGAKLYHGLAQCLTCHAAYETKQQIYDDSKELTGNGTTEFRAEMYQPEAKESDYADRHYPPAKDGTLQKLKLLPPDFLFNEVRDGTEVKDIFLTIASGVGGTAMPSWKGSLPDADVWALAHYVHSLIALKGKPGADALRQKLASAPPWTPPVEAPPPATDGGTPVEAPAK